MSNHEGCYEDCSLGNSPDYGYGCDGTWMEDPRNYPDYNPAWDDDLEDQPANDGMQR